MAQIVCTGRDGVQRSFMYWHEYDASLQVWDFYVSTDPLPTSGEVFNLTVQRLNDSTARSVMMRHHGEPAYVEKGIPEALLLEIKTVLGLTIESSPRCEAPGVYRNDHATKVWDRLLKQNLAQYDQSRTVYTLL